MAIIMLYSYTINAKETNRKLTIGDKMREHFVKLLSDYEQIAHKQISSLEQGLSKEEVVSAYKKTMENMKELRQNTDKQLEEHLYPMLRNTKKITDEDETELYAMAQKLSAYETRHDPGLALKIYEALLQWARHKKDDAKIVRYLYWCGITLFFFLTEQRERIIAYFEEGGSFANKYHTFSDPETRQYIHRCLGNVSMNTYAMKKGDQAAWAEKAMQIEEQNFSFWNGLIFSGKDLDFPWLTWFLSCLNHRHSHLTAKVHKDPDSETKQSLQKILDNAITMNKLYHKNRESFSVFGGTRYEYLLWEAQFLSGLISFDHLYENVYKKKAEFAADDFSLDAIYVKIQLCAFLMFYAAKMEKLKDRKDEIIATVSKDAIEQFSCIPLSVNPVSVSQLLKSFATNLSDVFEPAEQLEFVLKMSTYRHIPTYAHSVVVGKIAATLTKNLIEDSPECFVGFMDITQAEDVKNHAEKLSQFALSSGLCHDIGKISYICNPYMQARVHTEEELEIIKLHPDAGVQLMAREDTSAVNGGLIDVIRGHHKYYDDSGGYPEGFSIVESKHKIMIDIIAVADAIDSATDDIGYTCLEAVSLEEVCAEIKAGAGKQFSPIVTTALCNKTVLADLRNILDAERKDAYYKAYQHTWDMTVSK